MKIIVSESIVNELKKESYYKIAGPISWLKNLVDDWKIGWELGKQKYEQKKANPSWKRKLDQMMSDHVLDATGNPMKVKMSEAECNYDAENNIEICYHRKIFQESNGKQIFPIERINNEYGYLMTPKSFRNYYSGIRDMQGKGYGRGYGGLRRNRRDVKGILAKYRYKKRKDLMLDDDQVHDIISREIDKRNCNEYDENCVVGVLDNLDKNNILEKMSEEYEKKNKNNPTFNTPVGEGSHI